MKTHAENLEQCDFNASSWESTQREIELVIHLHQISVISKFKELSASCSTHFSISVGQELILFGFSKISCSSFFACISVSAKGIDTLVMGWVFHWRCNCPLMGPLSWLVICSKIHIYKGMTMNWIDIRDDGKGCWRSAESSYCLGLSLFCINKLKCLSFHVVEEIVHPLVVSSKFVWMFGLAR